MYPFPCMYRAPPRTRPDVEQTAGADSSYESSYDFMHRLQSYMQGRVYIILSMVYISDVRFLNESFFWAGSYDVNGRARTLVPGWWRKTHSRSSTSTSTRTEWAVAKFAEDYRGLNKNRMSRGEVCRGLPKILTIELLTLGVYHLSFSTVYCACRSYFKLFNLNQRVYQIGLFFLYTNDM